MGQRKRNITEHIQRTPLLIIIFALIVINTSAFLSIFPLKIHLFPCTINPLKLVCYILDT